MNNWYNDNIEDPLKEIVRFLRNRGVNTTCSCGHAMFIESDYSMGGSLLDLHTDLYNFICEKFGSDKTNYKIEVRISVEKGIISQSFIFIDLKDSGLAEKKLMRDDK